MSEGERTVWNEAWALFDELVELPDEDRARRLHLAASVNHAHGDLRLLGREAGKIRLRADDGEGALIDRGAVAQIILLKHQQPLARR